MATAPTLNILLIAIRLYTEFHLINNLGAIVAMDNTHDSMTVKEVIAYLRISDSTIRRMLGDGVLKRVSEDRKKVLISRDSVEEVAAALGRGPVIGPELRREISPTLKGLGELVQGLTQALQDKDERMLQLTHEMVALSQQLGEAKERARRLPDVETEVQQLRSELEQLRQELADLRAFKYYHDKVK